jgi:hypothetical protein
MKIVREVANKHMEHISQTYAKDHDRKAISYTYKEGDFAQLRIYNIKNKSKKLAKNGTVFIK